MTRNRDGIVLVVALLCILVIEVTAIGLHYATMQELRIADSATRDAQLRLAAQSAAALVLRRWPAETVDSLAIHDILPVEVNVSSANGIDTHASIERISQHVYLVRGYAVSPFREVAAIGALAATAAPADLAASVTAAVLDDGDVVLVHGASVSGGIARPETGTTAILGTLSFDRLAEIATSKGSSDIHYVKGNAMLEGVSQQHGLWLLDGDVEIRGGELSGIIISRGSLRMTNGASLHGAIVGVRESVLLDDADVTFDPSAVLTTLSIPELLGPYRARGRMWIPLF